MDSVDSLDSWGCHVSSIPPDYTSRGLTYKPHAKATVDIRIIFEGTRDSGGVEYDVIVEECTIAGINTSANKGTEKRNGEKPWKQPRVMTSCREKYNQGGWRLDSRFRDPRVKTSARQRSPQQAQRRAPAIIPFHQRKRKNTTCSLGGTTARKTLLFLLSCATRQLTRPTPSGVTAAQKQSPTAAALRAIPTAPPGRPLRGRPGSAALPRPAGQLPQGTPPVAPEVRRRRSPFKAPAAGLA